MKDNLFYLLEDDGRSLTVQNGVVTSISQPTPIPNAPNEWRNFVINWERIMAKFGIQRSFGSEMGFVKDAAKIVRKAVYGQSYERKINFLIQQLTTEVTDTLYRQIYKYLYKGELDLSTFNDEEVMAKCNIMEGGLVRLLKANEATVFEIPFGDDAINIKMDGIYVFQNASFLHSEIEERSTGFAGNFWKDLSTMSFPFLTMEGTSSGIAIFGQNQEQIDGSVSKEEYMAASSNYFAINNGSETVDFRIRGKLKFFVETKTGSVSYYADFNKQDGTSYSIFNNLVLTEGQTYEQDYDITVPLAPNEKLFLLNFFDNSGGGTNLAKIVFQETDAVRVDFKTRKETTYIKAYKPFNLFQKLIQRITGVIADAESQVLVEESNLVITSGDAIRGIEGAKIKTSLNQFFEHAAVAHFGGMGIENGKVVIEDRPHFFDASDPIHLGNAKDLKVNLATDIMGNTIKIGWPDPVVDDVNGKYAFNGSHLYTSVITRVVKEIPMISPYGSDPYEIEIIRINLEGKVTTDGSNDNKCYVVNVDIDSPEDVVDVGTVYPLKRVTYDNEGDAEDFGVPTTTIFNIEDLTPKRLLKKHGPWLRSLMHPFDLSKLVFQSTQRNSNLKTAQGSVIIQENAEQPVHLLGDRLFLPFYFEFDTEVPASLISLLEENPNRCFSFDWDGETYKGFTMKVSQAVNTEADQRIKLLAAPDNDLTKLIQ